MHSLNSRREFDLLLLTTRGLCWSYILYTLVPVFPLSPAQGWALSVSAFGKDSLLVSLAARRTGLTLGDRLPAVHRRCPSGWVTL